MKKWIRRIVLAAACLVFGVSAVRLGFTLWEYAQAEAIYQNLEDQVFHVQNAGDQEGLEVDKTIADKGPVVPTVDFDALEAVNREVVGWIWIPDTTVSYPLVQGSNNQYYVNTAYNQVRNPSGSIFLDYRVKGDFTSLNTIIYGHRMNNNTMFNCLVDFQDQEFLDEHPRVYIFTRESILIYDIFSAYVTEADSDTYTYSFSSQKAFSAWIGRMAGQSMVDGAAEDTEQPVITLSTCTNVYQSQRMVVLAQLDQTLPAGSELDLSAGGAAG